MNQGTIGGYWPLYEDGTPVRIGDIVEGVVVPMEVKGVEVYAMATRVVGDCDCLHLEPGDRVKRADVVPEGAPCLCGDPDGGVETTYIPRDEPNWHLVIDGVRYGVSSHARRVIADALYLCTSKRRLPPGIEWPVVDGEPVLPGDVLWDHSGSSHEVSGVSFTTGFISGSVLMADGGALVSMDNLTRTEPEPEQEPDSWERLATDARKEFLDYWSCRGIKCIDCPAKIGGHRPRQWYDTVNCVNAMDADIVRRIRALAGVMDDE